MDAFIINTLRHRKLLTRPDSSTVADTTDSSSNARSSIPLFLDSYPTVKSKVEKPTKYPKVTASYPKIPLDDKIQPRGPPKAKDISPKLTRPPISQPPVFLKCNPKKNLSRETTDEESEDTNSTIRQPPTDLDIHLNTLEHNSLMTSSLLPVNEKPSSVTSKNNDQILKQYYNFDEKKVVRVAPHIRRKDVICDTVDAWSNDNDRQITAELSRYKPLIFGGTYPIDVPIRDRVVGNMIQNRTNIVGKFISKTFDIDVPISNE